MIDSCENEPIPGVWNNSQRSVCRNCSYSWVKRAWAAVLSPAGGARFRRANPGYQLGKPFVYVGATGLDPDVRFDKHKAGIQANVYVQKWGLRLLPQLYLMYNPMPYEGARDMEVELGIALRELGYGVWQA